MSIAVDLFTDSWCGFGAAFKGGAVCGAKKVLNLIVYGLLVGSVVGRGILQGFLVWSWCGGFFKDSWCGIGAAIEMASDTHSNIHNDNQRDSQVIL